MLIKRDSYRIFGNLKLNHFYVILVSFKININELTIS